MVFPAPFCQRRSYARSLTMYVDHALLPEFTSGDTRAAVALGHGSACAWSFARQCQASDTAYIATAPSSSISRKLMPLHSALLLVAEIAVEGSFWVHGRQQIRCLKKSRCSPCDSSQS